MDVIEARIKRLVDESSISMIQRKINESIECYWSRKTLDYSY